MVVHVAMDSTVIIDDIRELNLMFSQCISSVELAWSTAASPVNQWSTCPHIPV